MSGAETTSESDGPAGNDGPAGADGPVGGDDAAPAGAAPRRPHRARRRFLAVLVTLVVVAAVVVYVEIRAAQPTKGVRPGELWEKNGSIGLDYAHTITFDLPSGQLVVKLATPVDSVPAADAPARIAGSDSTVRSGSEASFVPIVWTLQGSPTSVRDSPTYQFQVSLLDGDHRYDLHAGTSVANPPTAARPVVTSKQMTVVVAGDGGGLVVEVSYDGLTQRGFVGNDDVDPGVAAPYYDDDLQKTFTPSRPCRLFGKDQARTLDTEGFACEVGDVRTLPYVPGLGWVASKAASWAVVEVRIRSEADIRRGTRSYRVTHEPFAATLDGHLPAAVLLASDDGVTHSATYVFASTPTPKRFRLLASFTAHPRTRDGGRRGKQPGREFTFGTDRNVKLK